MDASEPKFYSLVGIAVTLLALTISPNARGYTPTVTPGGIPVRWKGPIKLEFAGNPVNHSGISEKDFYGAVVRGLQRWSSASGGAVGFDYWQGSDPVVYEPNSDFNGLSSIYFASNSKGNNGLSANILGLTQVWYDTSNGKIFETDIVLNDRDFHFTTHEQDTSGYGLGTAPRFGERNNVYIENVITHELGHALGLSHSGGLQSTMLFMESPDQAHLGCDDQTAIHALYPTGDAGLRGSIAGVVKSRSGDPVFGAHVLAISALRGTVLGTAMTDKQGHYNISALETGTYYLMLEPFFAGASPLPAYYSDINTAVCEGGRVFGRSMLTDSSGYRLAPIEVSGGQGVDAPAMIAECNVTSGAVIRAINSRSDLTGPPVLVDASSGAKHFGITDKLSRAGSTTYQLAHVSGPIEIHALAYSLYSPVHATLELRDDLGNPVSAQVFDRAYVSESGYTDYDSYLKTDALPKGTYSLSVTTRGLDASYYPAGPVSIDSEPFVVVTGTIHPSTPPLASVLSNNARCRAQEHFADYTSPPGPPARHSTVMSDQGGGIGFCGTTQDRTSGNSSNGSGGTGGPGAAAVVGWLLPWAFMLAIARSMAWQIRRSRQRREQFLLLG